MDNFAHIAIYQIFYDSPSRALIEPGYLPLDNTDSARRDWLEFWPIRKFLTETKLDPDGWYGFFSPRFAEKTKLDHAQVREFIETVDGHVDVALFSPYWDQIAYFQNPFEQGEYHHPGLLAATRRFFEAAGITLNLDRLVTDASSAVFSNYIVAKPAFWAAWLKLADALFEFVEHSDDPAAEALRAPTAYKGASDALAMKIFIQERLASVVLAIGDYRVATIDTSDSRRPPGLLPPRALRSLQTLDVLKGEFRRTGDGAFLEAYRKLRASIPMRPPVKPAGAPRSSQR
jgi:hypothetical protein